MISIFESLVGKIDYVTEWEKVVSADRHGKGEVRELRAKFKCWFYDTNDRVMYVNKEQAIKGRKALDSLSCNQLFEEYNSDAPIESPYQHWSFNMSELVVAIRKHSQTPLKDLLHDHRGTIIGKELGIA